jgi:hypothetical protein
MALVSDLESDCVEVDVEINLPPPRMRSRPQGNMAAKEDHKKMKLRDATIRAQAAATMEMAKVTKRKAQILEDQNVLMLFTTLEIGIMSEEAKEYLHLRRTIELKKLRRQVAEEEELEKQYIASQ